MNEPSAHPIHGPPAEPALPKPLTKEAAELIAARLRVIAEPMRIRMLDVLNDGSATRQALRTRLGTSPQNVSKHLGVLHQAGIVTRRREGGRVEYELIDWTGWRIVEWIAASITAHLDGQRDALASVAPDRLSR